jgi:NNP family nitrate/nitrite transporter-like MFS transporter
MSAYFVGYTIGQIPWGILADNYGSSKVMTLSILGISISTILFSFSFNPWMAIITRFLSGLLGAGVFVPNVRLVSGWFSKDRGTVLGVLSIGGSMGLVTASWIAPLLTVYLGWRITLVGFGIFGLIITLSMSQLLKDPKDTEIVNGLENISRPLKTRAFWILALGQFIRLGGYYTFIAWLPLLLREEFGFNLVTAGIAMSLFNIAGIFANPLGGLLSDHFGEISILAVSFIFMGLDIWGITGLIGGLFLYGVVFILGWFINFVRSPSFTIIPKLYSPEAAGGISGVHNTFASIGALILPLLLGYVKDITASYSWGWVILSFLMFFGAILLSTIKNPQHVSEPVNP